MVFEKYSELKKNFRRHKFWVRGYYVSSVGLDEGKVKKYVQDQQINESWEENQEVEGNPFGDK